MPVSYRLYLALVNELGAAALLLYGIDSGPLFLAFLTSHGLAIWFSLQFFGLVLAGDSGSRRIIGGSLFLPILTMACLPLIGPPGILMFSFVLKLYPVRALATEEYETVDSYLFEGLSSDFDMLLILKTNPIYAIHNRFTVEEALTLLRILDRLDWFPYKTRILQIFIEHCEHPSIVLEASRILQKKRDGILQRISFYEARGEPEHAILSSLYYELYYLDLAGPMIGDQYLRRACRHINDALKERPEDPAILLNAIKYGLQAGQYGVCGILVNRARPLVEPETVQMRQLMRFQEELRTVQLIESEKMTRLPEHHAEA